MSIVIKLQEAVVKSLTKLYNQPFTDKDFQINETKPDFEGDYTVVLFSLLKATQKNPESLGNELGNEIVTAYPTLFSGFNIIKGFLNIVVTDTYWLKIVQENHQDICFGKHPINGRPACAGHVGKC